MNTIPCLCINLDRRTDRWEKVKDELPKLGYELGATFHRFPAVALPSSPAAGCSMSHLRCLEVAKENKWSSVFICEDDIQILQPEVVLNQLSQFQRVTKSTHTKWDVLLIAGNNMVPYESPESADLQSCCIQIHHCLTTTGYIVQEHYYETFMANIRQGLQQLLRQQDAIQFAIDRYWFCLQERDAWYLLIPLSVVQREDYSDIEGKVTNFQSYMLNYNKAYKS